MMTALLTRLVAGESLTTPEAAQVMQTIMAGEATPAQIGAVVTALRMKRETPEEIAGFAQAMRENAVRVCPTRTPLLDTCGTGGDGCDTFNISTAAAFVAAAAGIGIAKHGNRAMSGRCGSADVLSALGVEMSLEPKRVEECIDRVGIGFLFAPNHHPAMRHAAAPRRELGIRTIFNLLGPLTNPSGAAYQVIGVYDEALCPMLAEVLRRLGCQGAMVVHGQDGLDEISTTAPTRISTLKNSEVTTELVAPDTFGLPVASLDALRGGDSPEENATILRRILEGEPGAKRDIVCVNAAASLQVAGVASTWRDGIAMAQEMLDSGRALVVLERLTAFTKRGAE